MTAKTFLCMTAIALVAASPALAQSTTPAAPQSTPSLLQRSVNEAAGAAVGGASATAEEAQRLTALFGRYLGQAAVGQQGPITITPEGQSYKLVVDLSRTVPTTAMPIPFELKTGTYVAMLTPQADGTWRVTSDTAPSISMTAADQTTTLTYGGFKFDGIFDPKLSGFRSATSTMTDMTMGAASPKGTMQTRYSGRTEMKQTTEAAGDGTVNTTISQAITDMAYKLSMTTPAAEPDGAPTAITVGAHAAKLTGESTVSNLHGAHLLDLWAFLVAHPSKEQLAASQAELKGLLLSLLPPGSVSARAEAQSLAVDTPEGKVGFGDLSESIEIGGPAGKDGFHVAFKFSGLALPDGLAPPWAEGLVPTGMSLDTTVGPVHVNDALLKLIAAFDLNADPPLTDQQGADITKALGSPEQVAVTLASSTVTTRLLTLKMRGASHYDLATSSPVGNAVVSAYGLDKAIDTLATRAKTAPEAAQALQYMVAMKQLATTEPDGSYSWKIDVAPGGAVTLNGKSMDSAKKTKKTGLKSTP